MKASSPKSKQKKPETGTSLKYLLARPVKQGNEEEIRTLQEIAGEVNLGNSRPSFIKDHVRASSRTLRKNNPIPLAQGLIFLASEFHDTDNNFKVVGSCKLQHLFDACWIMNVWPRDGHKGQFFSDIGIMTYSSKKTSTMEMAGNAVLEAYRGYGIGKFQIQARILYVLIHGIGGYKKLAANLLTVSDEDGKYVFYENVVKPLLGKTSAGKGGEIDVEYDDADRIRYNDAQLLDHLLGKVDERPPIQFPIHILPEYIRKDFAKVRDVTLRAKTVLERYGLREVNNYDLLDGGQYVARTVAEFKNTCGKFLRVVRLNSQNEIPEDAELITFTPIKISRAKVSREEFRVIRTHAILDDDHLTIAESVRRELEIPRESEVKVLLDHPQH